MVPATQALARYRAALSAADAASDPADRAVWRSVAEAWHKLSRPGVPYSMAPHRLQLAALARSAREALPEQPKPAPPVPPAHRYLEEHVPSIAF